MQKLFIHKKVLIVPLDWGLGHATRCIVLIRQLQQMGCEVIMASSGDQLILLKKEFPHLTAIQMKGYDVRYTRKKRWFAFKILLQSPKILLSIRNERKWLEKIVAELKIDVVISDNRYGLCTSMVPCVFMTHQLHIKAPYEWLEDLIQKINYRYINRYKECWVPDFEGRTNIAGSLSHPSKMPSIPVKYTGPLSRFRSNGNKTENKYAFAFILSGPEPQRTILEKKILSAIPGIKENCIILRGKPREDKEERDFQNCEIVNHLATEELQKVLEESEFVVSRCGYTTVMEMLSLQKKSILIPTPGQTEQEYLAEHLMVQRWCYSCQQEDDILSHLRKAKEFQYNLPSFETDYLKPVIESVLLRNFEADENAADAELRKDSTSVRRNEEEQ